MVTYRRQVGGVTVTLQGSYTGIGKMLRDHMMITGTSRYAQEIKTRAETTAPRDTGAYGRSFGVRSLVGPTGDNGRVYAHSVVYNTVHHALYIEWGNRRIRKHATLRRAAGQKNFSTDKGKARG